MRLKAGGGGGFGDVDGWLLRGATPETCRPDESVWVVEADPAAAARGGCATVNMTLDKVKRTWWGCVVRGDPEVDTTLVDSTCKMDECVRTLILPIFPRSPHATSFLRSARCIRSSGHDFTCTANNTTLPLPLPQVRRGDAGGDTENHVRPATKGAGSADIRRTRHRRPSRPSPPSPRLPVPPANCIRWRARRNARGNARGLAWGRRGLSCAIAHNSPKWELRINDHIRRVCVCAAGESPILDIRRPRAAEIALPPTLLLCVFVTSMFLFLRC
jgi:hypothetical protein